MESILALFNTNAALRCGPFDAVHCHTSPRCRALLIKSSVYTVPLYQYYHAARQLSEPCRRNVALLPLGWIPTKVRKPTAASNAEAIPNLTHQMSDVDSQLSNIAALLGTLTKDTVGSASVAAPLAQEAQAEVNNFDNANIQANSHFTTQTQQHSDRVHHATVATGQVPTANYPQQPHLSRTRTHALENDSSLTRQVAEALQAVANPFTTDQGKLAAFPYQRVARGSKKQKVTIREITLPENIWGMI